MNALDLAKHDEQGRKDHNDDIQKLKASGTDVSDMKYTPSLHLFGKTAQEYILDALRSIPSSHLEEALLVLPFDYTQRLLGYLVLYIGNPMLVELSMRCVLFIVKVHQTQLVSTASTREILVKIQQKLRPTLRQTSRIGFNIECMRHIQLAAKRSAEKMFMEDKLGILDELSTARKKPKLGLVS